MPVLVANAAGAELHALPREEVVERAAAEEADVLALARRGRGQAGCGCLGAHGGLRGSSQGQAQARQQLRRDAREHVRLVLRLVGASSDECAAAALDEARVVTGRYLPSPETLGDCDQRRQTVGAVAGRAGIRGLTPRVAGHERHDHGTAKGLASVERDVWQPEGVAALTGAQHGRGRAACALGIGCPLVDPQPEGEADDVAAPRSLAQQRDRGIHSTRHRDCDPPRRSHQRERPLRHASEGRVQRVERHRGAIPCSSAEPEIGHAVGMRRAGGVEEATTLAAPARPGGSGRGVRAGSRTEARGRDRAVRAERERDAHAVAARGSAGDPLAVGLRHAARKLEILHPQHQTTALARRRSALQRATASAAAAPSPSWLSAPKLSRSAHERPGGCDAHGGERGARARLGARTGRAGRSRDALLVEQLDERVPVHAVDQRERVPGRALRALADECHTGHDGRQRDLVAIPHGSIADVAAAIAARGGQRRGKAGGLRDAFRPRPQSALLAAAEQHGCERREAAAAEQPGALGAAELVGGDCRSDGAGQ